MTTVKIKIKRLKPNAILPHYGTEFSAGADLHALLDGDELVIPPHGTEFVHTGLSVEIPEGYVGLVYARSGIASKRGLAPANKVGVVDSDYRGEIIVSLLNHTDMPQTISNGERVAQLVIAPYLKADFVEADELAGSVRGEGGFGSTGA